MLKAPVVWISSLRFWRGHCTSRPCAITWLQSEDLGRQNTWSHMGLRQVLCPDPGCRHLSSAFTETLQIFQAVEKAKARIWGASDDRSDGNPVDTKRTGCKGRYPREQNASVTKGCSVLSGGLHATICRKNKHSITFYGSTPGSVNLGILGVQRSGQGTVCTTAQLYIFLKSFGFFT